MNSRDLEEYNSLKERFQKIEESASKFLFIEASCDPAQKIPEKAIHHLLKEARKLSTGATEEHIKQLEDTVNKMRVILPQVEIKQKEIDDFIDIARVFLRDCGLFVNRLTPYELSGSDKRILDQACCLHIQACALFSILYFSNYHPSNERASMELFNDGVNRNLSALNCLLDDNDEEKVNKILTYVLLVFTCVICHFYNKISGKKFKNETLKTAVDLLYAILKSLEDFIDNIMVKKNSILAAKGMLLLSIIKQSQLLSHLPASQKKLILDLEQGRALHEEAIKLINSQSVTSLERQLLLHTAYSIKLDYQHQKNENMGSLANFSVLMALKKEILDHPYLENIIEFIKNLTAQPDELYQPIIVYKKDEWTIPAMIFKMVGYIDDVLCDWYKKIKAAQEKIYPFDKSFDTLQKKFKNHLLDLSHPDNDWIKLSTFFKAKEKILTQLIIIYNFMITVKTLLHQADFDIITVTKKAFQEALRETSKQIYQLEEFKKYMDQENVKKKEQIENEEKKHQEAFDSLMKEEEKEKTKPVLRSKKNKGKNSKKVKKQKAQQPLSSEPITQETQALLTNATEPHPIVSSPPFEVPFLLPLPKSVEFVRCLLGPSTKVTGGAVRDAIISPNKNPKDYDLVISEHSLEEANELLSQQEFDGKPIIAEIIKGTSPILNVKMGDIKIQISILKTDIKSDQLLRDYTFNALYYDPENKKIIDYVGGYEDAKNYLINPIPDNEKLLNDPIKLLRALYLKAENDQLKFHENIVTLFNFYKNSLNEHPLNKIPRGTLYSLLHKLFSFGHALPAYRLLKEYNLISIFFPKTANYLAKEIDSPYSPFIEATLGHIDKITKAEITLENQILIFSVLLWGSLKDTLTEILENKTTSSFINSSNQVITEQLKLLYLPDEIWKEIMNVWLLLHYPKTLFLPCPNENTLAPQIAHCFRNLLEANQAQILIKKSYKILCQQNMFLSPTNAVAPPKEEEKKPILKSAS